MNEPLEKKISDLSEVYRKEKLKMLMNKVTRLEDQIELLKGGTGKQIG